MPGMYSTRRRAHFLWFFVCRVVPVVAQGVGRNNNNNMDYVQYISHHCQENWPWIDEIIYTPQSHPQVGIGGYIFSTKAITNHHLPRPAGESGGFGGNSDPYEDFRIQTNKYNLLCTLYEKSLVSADVGRGGPLDGKMYLYRYDHKKTNRNDQLDSMK